MKEKLLTRSLFARLMIVFVVVLTPLYIIGMMMNYWSVNVVKKEVNDSMMTQVDFYLEDLENEVESIKMLQYDCLYDENLNRLAILWEVMGLYERQQRMLQLQNRLVTIRNSASFLSDVSAHIIPVDKTISASEGIVPLKEEQLKNQATRDETGRAKLILQNEMMYMTTLVENSVMGDNGMFSIDVVFDEKRLMDKLSMLNTNENSGVMLWYHFEDTQWVQRSDSEGEATLLPTALVLEAIGKEGQNIETLTYEGEKYYIAYDTSEYLGMTFIKYVPAKIMMAPLRTLNLWFFVFTIVSAILLIVFSMSIRKYMHKPLTKLVKAFKKVEEGDVSIVVDHHSNDEFEYIYRRFNEMVARLNTLIDQVYKQKIMTQRAELKQLQSQINPHFLYNSFFLINMMARVMDDNLIPFTKKLGEYFRFVTKNNADLIALKDENNHAKVYADIQLMRFNKRLHIDFGEVPDGYEGILVPRLIIQPVIENAFEHAIERKKQGELKVSYKTFGNEDDEGRDNRLEIHVEDNGDGINEDNLEQLNAMIKHHEQDDISALINVHRRMQLVYGTDSGLRLEQSDLGGLKVIMCISK